MAMGMLEKAPSGLVDAPPEFYERIRRLIDAHHPHLRQARLRVQVRQSVPTIQFATSWAEVDTPNNEAEAAEFDFSLWFALDAWETLDDWQRDALTEHELYHCGFDDEGKPVLVPHSIEEFNGVLARYGLWWPDSRETRAVIDMLAQTGERIDKMPQGYQRPLQGGSSGSTGAGGSSGSTGAGGSSGSTGAKTGTPVWSDPDLVPGGDFHVIDVGNGRVIELSPAAYQAAVASIMADLNGAMGGQQGGSSGSTGA